MRTVWTEWRRLSLLPSETRRTDNGGLEIGDFVGKGARGARHPVIPGCGEPVREWLEAREKLGIPKRLSIGGERFTPPLLCSISNGTKGNRLDSKNVRAMNKRRAVHAGVEKRGHLHGLRHFHAYQLAQKGVKLHVVQKQLGHQRL